MCIEYNECHYGGMYNVYVKRILVITEIVHMNASVSFESRERKRLKSLSHNHEAWHPRSTPTSGRQVGGVTVKFMLHFTLKSINSLVHIVFYSVNFMS